jgi:vacuolar iron transporter family protein
MKHSLKTGICFGLTSGIITTLGLMTGLEAGTNSKLAVLGGIATIAVADAFSDALGIHVSEESENRHTGREIWESTAGTFIVKFLTASSFAIPVIFLDLTTAIYLSIVWGLLLLSALRACTWQGNRRKRPGRSLQNTFIAVVVIVAAHFIGLGISSAFV